MGSLVGNYRKILALDECIILDQAGTDSVFCNITKNYSSSNEVKTTEHPIEVEEGVPEITDAIHNLPRKIDLGFLLKPVIVPNNNYAAKDFTLSIKERFDKLDKWRRKGTLLQVIFGDESEPNVIIKSLTKSLSLDAYGALNLVIGFKEIRVYSTEGGQAIPVRVVAENEVFNRWTS